MRSFTIVLGLAILPFSGLVAAETVYVKYRGSVDLEPFKCETITRSSFINRLCYDEKEKYVIVLLKNTYYHYCEVPKSLVSSWLSVASMGRFYTSKIKGKYDCRVYHMPPYSN